MKSQENKATKKPDSQHSLKNSFENSFENREWVWAHGKFKGMWAWKVRGKFEGMWAWKVRGKFGGKGFESARKVRGVRDWVCGRGKFEESSGVV